MRGKEKPGRFFFPLLQSLSPALAMSPPSSQFLQTSPTIPSSPKQPSCRPRSAWQWLWSSGNAIFFFSLCSPVSGSGFLLWPIFEVLVFEMPYLAFQLFSHLVISSLYSMTSNRLPGTDWAFLTGFWLIQHLICVFHFLTHITFWIDSNLKK